MTFDMAKQRRVGDILKVYDPSIGTMGNFVIKGIEKIDKQIYFLMDNGLTYNHKDVDKPFCVINLKNHQDYYCSWCGWTNCVYLSGIKFRTSFIVALDR